MSFWEILCVIIAGAMWIMVIGFTICMCIWNFGPLFSKDKDAYSFTELNMKYNFRLYNLQLEASKKEQDIFYKKLFDNHKSKRS